MQKQSDKASPAWKAPKQNPNNKYMLSEQFNRYRKMLLTLSGVEIDDNIPVVLERFALESFQKLVQECKVIEMAVKEYNES